MSEFIGYEPIERTAGPRPLPAWVRDVHINWRHGWMNRPELKVRCRVDPLAFSNSGNPVWEKRENGMWIAEQDGVAAVHYHEGAVREDKFTRRIGGEWDISKPQLLDGEPWIDTAGLWPDQIPNAKPKMGGFEHETYTMLATTQQQGYAGRHIDVTLKDGSTVRLRGPWHGGAPDGYMEVYYDIDDHIEKYAVQRPGRRRKWHAIGGYFGLYVRTELMIDILSTFQPHVELAWVEQQVGNVVRRSFEPIVPQTGFPKGWFVPVEECPGHQFTVNWPPEGPNDPCAFCGTRRGEAIGQSYPKQSHGVHAARESEAA
jgi:hypothetical protein